MFWLVILVSGRLRIGIFSLVKLVSGGLPHGEIWWIGV